MKLALIFNCNQRIKMGERCYKVLSEYKNLEVSLNFPFLVDRLLIDKKLFFKLKRT
jgi:hypothetical protein